ncbi:MAG TPA: LamG-like jellyroll fold domain-containing protein, partial [Polyangiaceae bacterium]|nr:LamG-like jellyroll fold domain-containing protein [Polyangiaceae bacterium]
MLERLRPSSMWPFFLCVLALLGACGSPEEVADSAKKTPAPSNAVKQALVLQSYRDTVLGDSPTGYWRLGDTDNIARDASPVGRNGTYRGLHTDSRLPTRGLSGAIRDDVDTAARFFIWNNYAHWPVTDYNWVEVPHDASQSPAKLSLEAWVTLTPGGIPQTYSSIVMKADRTFEDGYGLYYYGYNVYFYVGGRNRRVAIPMPTSAVFASYRHVVATYDGINMRVYLDGVLQGTLYAPGVSTASAAPLTIGKGPYLGWQGLIDEVATYDYALSLEQIQEHYRAAAPSPIAQVNVSKTTVCDGETFQVAVSTNSLLDPPPTVTINGLTGTTRYMQFRGKGQYSVIATGTSGANTATKTVPITVVECPDQKFAKVIVRASGYRPYEAAFEVVNADELQGTNRRFVWDFGDGASSDKTVPYVTHSYATALRADLPILSFIATLRVKRDGVPDLVTTKTVTFKNLYAETKPLGHARMLVTNTTELGVDGKGLTGYFQIQNQESFPVRLTQRSYQKHFCDPSREPESLPVEAIDLTIPSASIAEQRVDLERARFGRDVCAVTVHLTGTLPDGAELRAAASLEIPSAVAPKGVFQPELAQLLNAVTFYGFVPNANHVTGEQLRTLEKQGLIQLPPQPEDEGDVLALEDGDAVGQVCHPEDQPPRAGLSCEVTDEWTVQGP